MLDNEFNNAPIREYIPNKPLLALTTHPLVPRVYGWSDPGEAMTSAERKDLMEAIAALRRALSRR